VIPHWACSGSGSTGSVVTLTRTVSVALNQASEHVKEYVVLDEGVTD